MNFSEQIKQTQRLLEGKKNILIALPKNPKGDAIASAIALLLFLKKLGKQVDVVADEFKLPHQLKFLPQSDTIKKEFSHLRKFIINIDIQKTGIKELSYDIKDNGLRIFITPKQGCLNKQDIGTAQSEFKYDIIFVINAQELTALGSLYNDNSELFYKKPVINIDNNPSNEYFGHMNIIDITSASTGEILFNMMQEWQDEMIDKDVAISLLTSMIFSTNSFKSNTVKPQTLTTASKLMHLGADREHIVKNLYRTRSLATLKLWGQALSHLQYDSDIGLVWTIITRDDFIRSGANTHDLYDIVDELITNSPEAKLILLFHEQNEQQENTPRIHIILDVEKNFNAQELLKPFSPVIGNKKQATSVIAGQSINHVVANVVGHIKKTLANKN